MGKEEKPHLRRGKLVAELKTVEARREELLQMIKEADERRAAVLKKWESIPDPGTSLLAVPFWCPNPKDHDWAFQPMFSDYPEKNGVKRYKCQKCGVWGWKRWRPTKTEPQTEPLMYKGEPTEPKPEWALKPRDERFYGGSQPDNSAEDGSYYRGPRRR